MKLLFQLILLFTLTSACHMYHTPKQEVEEKIKQWQKQYQSGYILDIQTQAIITKYHPENRDEPENLIVAHWHGMKITLAFNQALKTLETSSQSFQEHFSYVVLDDINHNIDINGWDIYPRTPQSSTSKGLNFINVTDKEVEFELNWETYTVFGYSDTPACRDRTRSYG